MGEQDRRHVQFVRIGIPTSTRSTRCSFASSIVVRDALAALLPWPHSSQMCYICDTQLVDQHMPTPNPRPFTQSHTTIVPPIVLEPCNTSRTIAVLQMRVHTGT